MSMLPPSPAQIVSDETLAKMVTWARERLALCRDIYLFENARPHYEQIAEALRELQSFRASARREARLREVMEKIAADWKSPPCTVTEGAMHVWQEFCRRIELAQDALRASASEET